MLKKYCYWRNEGKEGRKEERGGKEGGKKAREEGWEGDLMMTLAHDPPQVLQWNWITETSFKMEPGGQKRELPHTTTPARDPNRKRPTLHSQQEVISTLRPGQEEESFLLAQSQPRLWEWLQLSQPETITPLNSCCLPMDFPSKPPFPNSSLSLKRTFLSFAGLAFSFCYGKLVQNCSSLLFLNKPILLVK